MCLLGCLPGRPKIIIIIHVAGETNGTAEDVLDANGDESSKSRGFARYCRRQYMFLDELKSKKQVLRDEVFLYVI